MSIAGLYGVSLYGARLHGVRLTEADIVAVLMAPLDDLLDSLLEIAHPAKSPRPSAAINYLTLIPAEVANHARHYFSLVHKLNRTQITKGP